MKIAQAAQLDSRVRVTRFLDARPDEVFRASELETAAGGVRDVRHKTPPEYRWTYGAHTFYGRPSALAQLRKQLGAK